MEKIKIQFEAPWYTTEETLKEDLNDILNYIQKVTYAEDIEVEIENL